MRSLPETPTFSISVSFVGKRNYTTDEIKALLARSIEHSHRWMYQQDDRLADINLRVFIVHEQAFLGVRLAKRPLHERWYRRAQVVGALKPPVAAALVMLGEAREGIRPVVAAVRSLLRARCKVRPFLGAIAIQPRCRLPA